MNRSMLVFYKTELLYWIFQFNWIFTAVFVCFRVAVSVCSTEGDKATLQEQAGWLRAERLPVSEEITGAENQTD